jgi:hypothetical protein
MCTDCYVLQKWECIVALPLLMHMCQCATKTNTSPRHTTHPAATFLTPAPSVSPPNDYYRMPISLTQQRWRAHNTTPAPHPNPSHPHDHIPQWPPLLDHHNHCTPSLTYRPPRPRPPHSSLLHPKRRRTPAHPSAPSPLTTTTHSCSFVCHDGRHHPRSTSLTL